MVVSLYYYKDLTIKEIANIMQLSDSRVSQLHTKSILRLRGRLARLKNDLMS
jgi:RNA polymerase sigma factor for flagellar operon FliA